ncbi:MFS transporter [Streptomyces sp. NPDC050504]|uniref:MFS transporter n=1 Tax=Streptomyces sp. NPDC050504 TaxID=3365618 RepID=UPI00379D7E91
MPTAPERAVPGAGPLHRRVAFAGSVVGAVVVALDGTVLTVVQPTLQRDLGASFAQVQWTSTGYLIAVASLLVLAGRLGDRYGHQRLFALGILGFAAATAAICVAPGIGWVVGLRVAQGVCGALLQPATLGMLRAAFPPDRLGMPIALRTAAIGLAAATGPLIGGLLAAQWGWRSVFALSAVPAAAVGLLALVPVLKERRAAARSGSGPRPAPGTPGTAGTPGTPRTPSTPRTPGAPGTPRTSLIHALDLPGALLLATALGALVYALTALSEHGWTSAPAAYAALLVAAVAAPVLVRHERRAPHPLLPPGGLGARTSAALAVLVCASATFSGTLFVATFFLQGVLGLDPLGTGLRMAPLAVAMVLTAPAAPVLARRHGPRAVVTAAMAALATGTLLFARLGTEADALAIGGCAVLMGAGFGAVMVTATEVVVKRAPAHVAGVAGGLQQTAMNTGPVLGVAAATALLAASAPAGGATPGGASAEGAHWAGGAFLSAMDPALTVLAVASVLGALLARRLPGAAQA